MKRLFITFLLAMIVIGCTTIRPTWAELWGPGDTRSDTVDMLLGVRTMSRDDLQALCSEMNGLNGCASDVWVFLVGFPEEHALLFKVQYVATYAALKVECDTEPACFKNNILYTMDYSTRGPKSEYRMGVIGDLISDAGNMNLTFNNRVYLGQLFMGILAG